MFDWSQGDRSWSQENSDGDNRCSNAHHAIRWQQIQYDTAEMPEKNGALKHHVLTLPYLVQLEGLGPKLRTAATSGRGRLSRSGPRNRVSTVSCHTRCDVFFGFLP